MKHLWFISLVMCLVIGYPAMGGDWVSWNQTPESGKVSITAVESDSSRTVVRVRVPGMDVIERRGNGEIFKQIMVPGAGYLNEPGAPLLPAVRVRVAVPDTGDVSLDVRILDETTVENIRIWPAQPSYDRDAVVKPPFTMNERIYQSRDLYPETTADIESDGWLRDYRTVLVFSLCTSRTS